MNELKSIEIEEIGRVLCTVGYYIQKDRTGDLSGTDSNAIDIVIKGLLQPRGAGRPHVISRVMVLPAG